MDIAILQAFLSVAENASFSVAAEHLHLTQPAVSKRVASLEAMLDSRLFDRIGRRVSLTEAGIALLPRARRILNEQEDSRRAIANLSGEIGGTLRVGTSHHIGLHRLPPALKAFTLRYPEVQLDLQFMDSEAACRAVEHGDLELGIVTLPPIAPEDLTLTPVWPDPLQVVAAADHPLMQRKRPTLKHLCAYPAILPATGTFTRQIAEQAFAPLGLDLKPGLSTNYLETIKMLVSVGLGWSVLPATMTDNQVKTVSVPGLQLQRTLGIVQHRDRTLSNAAGALSGLLLK